MSNFFGLEASDIASLSCKDVGSLGKEARFYISVKNRIFGLERYFIRYVDKSDASRALLNKEILVLKGILHRLDINNLIPNSNDVELFRSRGKTLKDHASRVFVGCYEFDSYGDRSDDSFLNFYLEKLVKLTVEGRKAELKRRLLLACQKRLVDEKWYCVFNTLTVDPDRYKIVFSRGSKEWRKYIENCDNLFGIAAFGSVRKAKLAKKRGEKYHEYFAVTEEGSKSGRLHIHVLHFFSTLPVRSLSSANYSSFGDPNYGCSAPVKREILGMKSLWRNGFSSPIAVRFSQDDAYGLKGWLWPVCLKDGQYVPIKSNVPNALINYVAKYLEKDYSKCHGNVSYVKLSREGELLWRVKMTRNLGQEKVLMISQKIPLEVKKTVIRERLTVQIQGQRLPSQLLRKLLLNQIGQSHLSYARLILLDGLGMWRPQKNIVERIHDMMKRLEIPSQVKFGDIRTIGIVQPVGSSFLDSLFLKPIGGVCEGIA